MRPIIAALIIAGLACGAWAEPAPMAPSAPADAGVGGDFYDADGHNVGRVRLHEGPTGVLVNLEVRGLTPGWHGQHFHEKGVCSDAGFKLSGGHMNHDPKRSHGLLSAGGPDFGDLANLWVGSDGVGHGQMFSSLVSLHGAGGRPALLDADGSALVVHANHDDQSSQPIGGAGARVACAVIAPVVPPK